MSKLSVFQYPARYEPRGGLFRSGQMDLQCAGEYVRHDLFADLRYECHVMQSEIDHLREQVLALQAEAVRRGCAEFILDRGNRPTWQWKPIPSTQNETLTAG